MSYIHLARGRGLRPGPGVSTGTKRVVLQTEALLWLLSFGFVSGHDFSRAVKNGKRIGLQPLLGRILPEILVRRQFWGEESPGAKESA